MLIAIENARYLDGYRIWLRFNTGEEGFADLTDIVHRYQIAAPLRDPAAIAKFHLDDWPTVAWPCGFDVSPESLYERATGRRIEWLERAAAGSP